MASLSNTNTNYLFKNKLKEMLEDIIYSFPLYIYSIFSKDRIDMAKRHTRNARCKSRRHHSKRMRKHTRKHRGGRGGDFGGNTGRNPLTTGASQQLSQWSF